MPAGSGYNSSGNDSKVTTMCKRKQAQQNICENPGVREKQLNQLFAALSDPAGISRNGFSFASPRRAFFQNEHRWVGNVMN